ncbi:conserved hypothetical protein [Paraburkholderia piptadeniae]|uniref:SDR family oxidoreductase n=1 Tax=Paraburkholderia piptadeniae TaxID=1701573 RepID=A0A1N7SE65_9BURK|nr:SDR family NAD(P)-dependent oxidoreductase [Paraburkholderia piptadeniae]SIT45667.1 conserved hypothetical protein [Paraburkholderia piptadeniae]
MTYRSAVVTGAAGVIGTATVLKLLEDGRGVVAVDTNADRLAALKQSANGEIVTVCVDVAAPDASETISLAAEALPVPPTILVNNAGISPKHNGLAASALDVTLEEWNRVFEVNVTAALRLAKAFIPNMQGQRWGRIVNVTSRAGKSNVGNAGPAYVTSKAALLGLTRSIACDYARDGITCNSVAPGVVASHLWSTMPPQLMQSLVDKTPLGRAGTAREIGAVIAFLASEDAGFVTGASYDVNGGQSML